MAVDLHKVEAGKVVASLPLVRSESAPPRAAWLFSRNVDLGVFLGSAVVSLLALWIGARAGVLYDDTPDWAWIPAILLIDVAHVYSTAFRVYFDKEEFRRRPHLYAIVPLIGLAVGVALYSEGELVFWRALAYVAVFHFVRQQYGWVALYRAQAGECDRFGRYIDTVAIYSATVYPLIYWHTNLPRSFWWFLANDFMAIPSLAAQVAAPLYWLAMIAYAGKSTYYALMKRRWNPGKDIVVATTALCWYVGIVAFNSDYAFTVTNVVIHGVPYLALIYWYSRKRYEQLDGRRDDGGGKAGVWRLFARGPAAFLILLWLFAYVEELVWDRGVWHDKGWFFGAAWELGSWKILVVPLLALPQLTHYVLDGFIWRRRSNPRFSLAPSKGAQG